MDKKALELRKKVLEKLAQDEERIGRPMPARITGIEPPVPYPEEEFPPARQHTKHVWLPEVKTDFTPTGWWRCQVCSARVRSKEKPPAKLEIEPGAVLKKLEAWFTDQSVVAAIFDDLENIEVEFQSWEAKVRESGERGAFSVIRLWSNKVPLLIHKVEYNVLNKINPVADMRVLASAMEEASTNANLISYREVLIKWFPKTNEALKRIDKSFFEHVALESETVAIEQFDRYVLPDYMDPSRVNLAGLTDSRGRRFYDDEGHITEAGREAQRKQRGYIDKEANREQIKEQVNRHLGEAVFPATGEPVKDIAPVDISGYRYMRKRGFWYQFWLLRGWIKIDDGAQQFSLDIQARELGLDV